MAEEPGRGITRREVLARVSIALGGVATGVLAGRLVPEQEGNKEGVLKLPAIVGVVYRRNSSDNQREVGYFPDAGDIPISREEIVLDRMDETVRDGKIQVGITKTNGEGVYVFPGLAPGVYQIGVSPRYQEDRKFAVQGSSQKITVTPDSTIIVGPIIGRLN